MSGNLLLQCGSAALGTFGAHDMSQLIPHLAITSVD
jgi:hypothetical protein